jgi:hypothetical protein
MVKYCSEKAVARYFESTLQVDSNCFQCFATHVHVRQIVRKNTGRQCSDPDP